MLTTLRPLNWPADRAAIAVLDTSFTTHRIYQVQALPHSFTLVETPISPALQKTYDLSDELDDLPNFAHVVVVEHGGQVVGMAAIKFEEWNGRAVIWHLYLTPAARGGGVGRSLIENLSQAATRLNAHCLWLETQNVNYPAIQFYTKMGFVWCGLDTTLYAPESSAGSETALYFARPI